MPHSLDEMILEAAKLHAQQLGFLIKRLGVCLKCRVNPIQVITRPPIIRIDLVESILLDVDAGVRIEEVVQLLCLDCAPDIYQRRSNATDPSEQG